MKIIVIIPIQELAVITGKPERVVEHYSVGTQVEVTKIVQQTTAVMEASERAKSFATSLRTMADAIELSADRFIVIPEKPKTKGETNG